MALRPSHRPDGAGRLCPRQRRARRGVHGDLDRRRRGHGAPRGAHRRGRRRARSHGGNPGPAAKLGARRRRGIRPHRARRRSLRRVSRDRDAVARGSATRGDLGSARRHGVGDPRHLARCGTRPIGHRLRRRHRGGGRTARRDHPARRPRRPPPDEHTRVHRVAPSRARIRRAGERVGVRPIRRPRPQSARGGTT